MPRQAAYESLDREARELVDRWVSELACAPAETGAVFRFPVAMAAVGAGRRLIPSHPGVACSRGGRAAMFLVPWPWAGRRAQGLTECGLILALISIAAILALAFLGTAIGSLISNTRSMMDYVKHP